MLTQEQKDRKQYMESVGMKLHEIPFELWEDGDHVTFAERGTHSHVLVRWMPKTKHSGKLAILSLEKYLSFPHEDFICSFGYPCDELHAVRTYQGYFNK